MLMSTCVNLLPLLTEFRFVNDIPRWASLLSPHDRCLFAEIASHLWGIPIPTIMMDQGETKTFNRKKALTFLQFVVKKLVSTSGLFDHGCGSSSNGSYRLQSLRQRHFSQVNHWTAHESRLSLAEWHPLLESRGPGDLRQDVPGPLDPEENHLSVLARITTLMAGAIFGAILLYLCCKDSSRTPLLPPG